MASSGTSPGVGGDARFCGAWQLVSFTEREPLPDGGEAVRHPYGADARGYIVYTPCGVVSYQLCAGAGSRPRFSSGDFMRGTPAELAAAASTFRSYVARWRADAAAGVVTHDVELSFHPDRESVRLRRRYAFSADGDELELVPLAADGGGAASAGGKREALVWRRVRC